MTRGPRRRPTAPTSRMRGTRRATRVNSRIDYIYFSHGAKDLTLKSSQVFDTRDDNGVAPSDHKPLMSIFTCEIKRRTSARRIRAKRVRRVPAILSEPPTPSPPPTESPPPFDPIYCVG